MIVHVEINQVADFFNLGKLLIAVTLIVGDLWKEVFVLKEAIFTTYSRARRVLEELLNGV